MIAKYAFGAAILLAAISVQAHAVVPLVDPVTISGPIGSTKHLTPIDQNSAPIPIAQCTLTGLPTTIATFVKDATGVALTSVGPGTSQVVRWSCTDGFTTVTSLAFSVTVPNPPYAVTAVGDTTP